MDFDEQILQQIIQKVKIRGRLNDIENQIAPPNDEEILEAFEKAFAEISLALTPLSSSSIENPLIKEILITCTAKNVIETLIFQWTAQGVEAIVEGFSIKDRLNDYHSLFKLLEEECDKKIGEMKKRLVYIKSFRFPTYPPTKFG